MKRVTSIAWRRAVGDNEAGTIIVRYDDGSLDRSPGTKDAAAARVSELFTDTLYTVLQIEDGVRWFHGTGGQPPIDSDANK